MDNQTMALALGTLILTHGASLFAAFKWGFKHLIDYNIALTRITTLEASAELSKKDLNAAFKKIRELETKCNPEQCHKCQQ